MHLNIEIKAKSQRIDSIRTYLTDRGADYKGTDHQIDTYFKIPSGRMKLREGKIENSLIFYKRADQAGPKASEVFLYHPGQESIELKALLENALGVKKIVDKQREIYFIDNVKFHLDQVKGLGTFVEIEAIDADGDIGREKLLEQCQFYMKAFKIAEADLLEKSYADMVK